MNDCGVSRGGSPSSKTLLGERCLTRFFPQTDCISIECANAGGDIRRIQRAAALPAVSKFGDSRRTRRSFAAAMCAAAVMLVTLDPSEFISAGSGSPSVLAAEASDPETPNAVGPKPDAPKPAGPKPDSPKPGTNPDDKTGDKPGEKPADKAGDETPEKAADGKPRKPEILIKHKDFKREGDNAALRVSFDDIDLLKVLNMELVSANCIELMPEWLSKLDGKRIRIRGYMHPFAAISDKIIEFPLARDTEICCFGRNPKMYDIIQVKMKTGVSTPFIDLKPFDVEGILRIKLDEGFTGEVPPSEDEYPQFGGLYYLDDAVIVKRQ